MIYTLLIQIHNKTGLKYLCKTASENFYQYKGSGKYWKRHLKIHGRDVKSYVLYQSNDLSLFCEKCLFYSNHYDVVNNKSWANLISETGMDGGKTHNDPYWLKTFKHSDETKAIIGKASREAAQRRRDNGCITKSFLGKTHTEEAKQKQSTAAKGKPKSTEHKLALSLSQKGKPSSMSQEGRNKNASSFREISLRKYKCSICNKVANAGQLGRYHKECQKINTWKKVLI